jgi:hypothetical protein
MFKEDTAELMRDTALTIFVREEEFTISVSEELSGHGFIVYNINSSGKFYDCIVHDVETNEFILIGNYSQDEYIFNILVNKIRSRV